MVAGGKEDELHLSVVAPAYNEPENLAPLVREIAAVLLDFTQAWEIVIVDDGSDDDTPAVLRRLRGECPRLRVLRLGRRSGQAVALDADMRAARGRFIATLDADLQSDPADIPRLLDMVASGECDMVSGWRKDRKDPPLRLVCAWIGSRLRNWITRDSIRDSGCALKVFRRECIARTKLSGGMHWFFSTLVGMEGYRVKEVPVNHRPRRAGKAKYGLWNRPFKFLQDAVAVRRMRERKLLGARAKEWPKDAASAGPKGR